MRILVTGGAGFLGYHLCKRLLSQGHSVVCLDNFSTGQVTNCHEHLNFELIESDVCTMDELQSDMIYNLACPASPPHYQRDPVQTLKTNTVGVINVLECAKNQKIPVLQASTSEVYGDPDIHPQREDYWGHVNPNGPRACYDEGKRVAETLCLDYQRSYGVDVKIPRIFNTYGPNMDPQDGRVVSNFIVQALKGDPITIYGDGSQTRSFCFVDDLIDGFLALMESDWVGPMNLGNPQEFTMLELAELVLELTGSSSQITFSPLPTDDPRQRCPDISKAKEVLGWSPNVDTRHGLVETAKYFGHISEKARATS